MSYRPLKPEDKRGQTQSRVQDGRSGHNSSQRWRYAEADHDRRAHIYRSGQEQTGANGHYSRDNRHAAARPALQDERRRRRSRSPDSIEIRSTAETGRWSRNQTKATNQGQAGTKNETKEQGPAPALKVAHLGPEQHEEVEMASKQLHHDSSEPRYGDADDEAVPDIAKLMGFGGFGTTKGTHIGGNSAGGANVKKPTAGLMRQYMQRVGGFNRPLDVQKAYHKTD